MSVSVSLFALSGYTINSVMALEARAVPGGPEILHSFTTLIFFFFLNKMQLESDFGRLLNLFWSYNEYSHSSVSRQSYI